MTQRDVRCTLCGDLSAAWVPSQVPTDHIGGTRTETKSANHYSVSHYGCAVKTVLQRAAKAPILPAHPWLSVGGKHARCFSRIDCPGRIGRAPGRRIIDYTFRPHAPKVLRVGLYLNGRRNPVFLRRISDHHHPASKLISADSAYRPNVAMRLDGSSALVDYLADPQPIKLPLDRIHLEGNTTGDFGHSAARRLRC